jgi:hypothetical protein
MINFAMGARSGAIRLWVTVPIVVFVLIQAPAATAVAPGNCTTVVDHLFDGKTQGTTDTGSYGVKGTLTLQTAGVCTSQDVSRTSMWVMLTGAKASDGWAQIGFIKKGGATECGCYRYFWEWSKYGNPLTDDHQAYWQNGVVPPETHEWQASLNLADGKAYMIGPDGATPPNNANGDPPHTDFRPLLDNVWTGTNMQILTEILWIQNDFMGSASSGTAPHAIFDTLRKRASNGNWSTVNFDDGTWVSFDDGGCWSHKYRTPGTTDYMETWTDPYNHSC